MSTTTSSAKGIASNSKNNYVFHTLWSDRNEKSPTKEEEDRARNYSLNAGNKTSIGYDYQTNLYNPDNESQGKKDWYECLDSHNRDNYWKYREEVNISRDYDQQLKLKAALGIADQLGLSERHKQIVIEQLFEIDGRRFGQRNEAVIFCLCAIVMNKEAKRYGDENIYHPSRNDSNNDHEFVRVQDQLITAFSTITESRLRSIYAKLSQGQPPLKNDEQTELFVRGNNRVQHRPSFAPEHSLPQPTGDV